MTSQNISNNQKLEQKNQKTTLNNKFGGTLSTMVGTTGAFLAKNNDELKQEKTNCNNIDKEKELNIATNSKEEVNLKQSHISSELVNNLLRVYDAFSHLEKERNFDIDTINYINGFNTELAQDMALANVVSVIFKQTCIKIMAEQPNVKDDFIQAVNGLIEFLNNEKSSYGLSHYIGKYKEIIKESIDRNDSFEQIINNTYGHAVKI